MNYEEFKHLVKEYKQTKKEYIDIAAIGSVRQDDEYTMKAMAMYNKLNLLMQQIKDEIEKTNDDRIKNYFATQKAEIFLD